LVLIITGVVGFSLLFRMLPGNLLILCAGMAASEAPPLY